MILSGCIHVENYAISRLKCWTGFSPPSLLWQRTNPTQGIVNKKDEGFTVGLVPLTLPPGMLVDWRRRGPKSLVSETGAELGPALGTRLSIATVLSTGARARVWLHGPTSLKGYNPFPRNGSRRVFHAARCRQSRQYTQPVLQTKVRLSPPCATTTNPTVRLDMSNPQRGRWQDRGACSPCARARGGAVPRLENIRVV